MKTIAIAAAALIAMSAPAAAQEHTARVSYADLDLANAGDRAVLERRIGRALESVCGSYASVATGDADRIGACRTAAKADAGRRVELIAARQAQQRLAGR